MKIAEGVTKHTYNKEFLVECFVCRYLVKTVRTVLKLDIVTAIRLFDYDDNLSICIPKYNISTHCINEYI